MLAAVVPDNAPGHQDWGWTERVDEIPMDAARLDRFIPEAEALVARRRTAVEPHESTPGATAACWGWKDPRTSVLLDFWDARVPAARYIFTYRAPWDVAESMQRLGAEPFLRDPDLAFRIWRHYNRALMTFARRHRDRVVLVNASAVLRAPGALLTCIRDRFDMALDADDLGGIADISLLSIADPDAARFAAALHADCTALLRELEDLADLPGRAPLPSPLVAPPAATSPRISIVIPCFNDGAFLGDAIASVERTVTIPYELTIVDDGSDERQTQEIVRELERAGYRVLTLEHRGLAHARNRGIAQAQCDVVLPLDADNRLRTGFVEAALDVLARNSDVVAVYGDRYEFGQRSGRVEVGVPDLDRLLCGNYIDACAVIRRDAWRACGGYDEAMPVQGHEDWELWLSMLERGFTLQRLGMVAFDYRVRPDSMLSRTSPDVQAAIERYVLAKHAPFYLTHLRRQVDRLAAATTPLASPRRRRLASAWRRLSALTSVLRR
jgi:hypothetical protein